MSETLKPIKWAGGEHAMTLNHPWVRNVLSVCGLPGDYGNTPAACFKRFSSDLYSIEDIERIFYLGLIGGGMTIRDAQAVVEKEISTRPLLETGPVAMAVLSTLFADLTDVETEAA